MKRPIALLAVALALGVAIMILSRSVAPSPPIVTPALPASRVAVDGVKVTFYFADPNTSMLVPVTRQLDRSQANLQTVLRGFFAGPKPDEHAESLLPKGTQLLGATLKDGVVTVNLNGAFRTNFPKSSAASILAVYSIVDTLTSLPGVDTVAFQIEGKPVSVLGEFDLSQPLAMNPSVIAKQ